jgi:uncharacterized membrane protein
MGASHLFYDIDLCESRLFFAWKSKGLFEVTTLKLRICTFITWAPRLIYTVATFSAVCVHCTVQLQLARAQFTPRKFGFVPRVPRLERPLLFLQLLRRNFCLIIRIHVRKPWWEEASAGGHDGWP